MNTETCALLLVAHGSRLEAANEEIANMAVRLREQVQKDYQIVRHAFLEIAEPDIPTGIDSCVMGGAATVLVLPYFLAAGRHVRDDIPGIVEEARRKYPEVHIHVQDYLGMNEAMPEFLARSINMEERVN